MPLDRVVTLSQKRRDPSTKGSKTTERRIWAQRMSQSLEPTPIDAAIFNALNTRVSNIKAVFRVRYDPTIQRNDVLIDDLFTWTIDGLVDDVTDHGRRRFTDVLVSRYSSPA